MSEMFVKIDNKVKAMDTKEKIMKYTFLSVKITEGYLSDPLEIYEHMELKKSLEKVYKFYKKEITK